MRDESIRFIEEIEEIDEIEGMAGVMVGCRACCSSAVSCKVFRYLPLTYP